jgi:dTDP-4-dehydrorhamnose reductase
MKILVTGANGQLGRSMRKISGDYPQHEFLFTDMPEMDITEKAGIEAFVNLTDDRRTATNYKGYFDTYYSTKNVT